MSQFDRQNYERSDRERILARYLGASSIRGDNRRLVKGFLISAGWWAVATPAMFYARFGVIDWFAISFTIFLVVLHLPFALGLYFRGKTEYHTQVPMEGTFADRVGAFWLVACAFGPFIGWVITVFGVTESSWRWQYLARAFLAVILPVITAVPLVHYARGKAALIAVPLLIVITALPILTCLWVIGDLHDGAKIVNVEVLRFGPEGQPNCQTLDRDSGDVPCEEIRPALAGERFKVTWLSHTRQVFSERKTHALTRSLRTTRTPARQSSLISKR